MQPNIDRVSGKKDETSKVFSYDQLMAKKQKQKAREEQFEEEAENLYEILNCFHSISFLSE